MLIERVAVEKLTADYIVPVPLAAERLAERGYNQAEVLAVGLAEGTGIPVSTGLQRTRWTVPQAQLRGEYRAKNLIGAFAWQGEAIAGKTMLLIDDVISTGATVDECAKALKLAGAGRVIALALGRGTGKG